MKKLLIAALFFTACNNAEENSTDNSLPLPKNQSEQPVKEDSLTLLIRPHLTEAVKKDIEGGGLKSIGLNITKVQSIQVTAAEFYTLKKTELEKQMSLSSDKEKTKKAISYLEKKILSAAKEPPVYKVNYHLSAQVGKIIYNDDRTTYLNKDFAEIEIIFPH
jgi:hypothetical protein